MYDLNVLLFFCLSTNIIFCVSVSGDDVADDPDAVTYAVVVTKQRRNTGSLDFMLTLITRVALCRCHPFWKLWLSCCYQKRLRRAPQQHRWILFKSSLRVCVFLFSTQLMLLIVWVSTLRQTTAETHRVKEANGPLIASVCPYLKLALYSSSFSLTVGFSVSDEDEFSHQLVYSAVTISKTPKAPEPGSYVMKKMLAIYNISDVF